MPRPHRHIRLLTVLAAIAACVGLLTGERALADPDFSNVSDMLGGRRHLLRIDDVVVVKVEQGVAATLVLPTSNSRVSTTQFAGSFAVSNPNPAFSSAVSQGEDIAPHALGRLANLPRDILVSLLLGQDGRWHFFATDHQTNAGATAIVPTSIQPASQGQSGQAVVLADFDTDGFVEALIAYLGQNAQGQLQGGMRIVKPVDVNDLTQGVTFGPEWTSTDLGLPFSTLKTGDVNGDGFPEILSFNGTTLSVSTVDPKTFKLTLATTVSLPNNGFVFPFNLIAGRFRDTLFDDVVLAGQLHGDPNGVRVYAISGDLNLNLKPVTSVFFPSNLPHEGQPLHVFLAKGPLTAFAGPTFGGQDLLVMGTASHVHGYVAVLASDENLNFTMVSNTDVTNWDFEFGCLYGLAVGNFDNLQPGQFGQLQHNPALQIATFWRSLNIGLPGYPPFDLPPSPPFPPPPFLCDTKQLVLPPPWNEISPQNNPAIRIWSVTPSETSSNWLTKLHDFEPFGGVDPNTGLVLAVGDAQGRSKVLGPPTKVTILGDIRPDIVLGIPPMHIDWINPVNKLDPQGYPGCNNPPHPCVLNLTVMPSLPYGTPGFSTSYDFTSTADHNMQRSSTTSWSLGVKLTQESKTTIGDPDTASISIDIKQSAGYTHDGIITKTYNTYSSSSDSIKATTGFSDHVWYTQKRMNIYYYPVLGETACPAASPNCADNEKLPLYVAFSGPDQVTSIEIDAATQEWYQPVHEPGNIFSYPWDPEQLKQAFPGLIPLTTDPAPWRGTDTVESDYITTWSNTTQESSSSGSTNTETYSLSIAVSGNAGIKGEGGEEASAEFDLNQSLSVSTLNVRTQTLLASTGIQVNKPAFSSTIANNYSYLFGGYVFGLTNPADVLQTQDCSPDPEPGTLCLKDTGGPIDIATTGPLFVGFVAQPELNANTFWQKAYNLPDVGLSHPVRWNWDSETHTVSFNDAAKQPDDFYQMKGFFITPANANGQGPNRTTATAGDQLTLTARVYNFSLVDTNDPSLAVPAASIHVRFYGQRHDNATGSLSDQPFQIGEDQTIACLRGFNASSAASNCPWGSSNWTTVSVPFDTGGTSCGGQSCADAYLVFWVVVWMEDKNGNLVPELPGHGLTSKFNPNLTFAQITDVPVEPYSNNVGKYGSTAFYIAPQTPSPASALGALAIDSLAVSPTPLLVDQKARVNVRLRTDAQRSGPMVVVYYNGDPLNSGKAFDVHHIAHVRPNDTYLSKGTFRPQTCGEHTLVVVAEPASAVPATARTTVAVTIMPEPAVDALIASTTRLDLPGEATVRLLPKLERAKWAFAHNFPRLGVNRLQAFIGEVEVQRGATLTTQQADLLIGQAKLIISCV
jgi:hypothetical protein